MNKNCWWEQINLLIMENLTNGKREAYRCSFWHYSCRSSSVSDISWFRLKKIPGINKSVRRWGGGEEGCRQTWLKLLKAWLSDCQEGSTDSLYEAVQGCSAGTPPPVPSRSCSMALVLEDKAPDPGRLISTVRRSINQSRPFAWEKPSWLWKYNYQTHLTAAAKICRFNSR